MFVKKLLTGLQFEGLESVLVSLVTQNKMQYEKNIYASAGNHLPVCR
jgi:hypothetical protein